MINAIWSYNNRSKGCRLLSRALECKIIRKNNSRFRWKPHKIIVNWGSLDCPTDLGRIINRPSNVALARDKLRAFRRWKDVDTISIPDFTDSRQEALGWLRTGDVCLRHTTTGHEGIGLEIASAGQETLSYAPLYTKYIKKQSEWRIHVVFGEAVHVQQKVRRRDFAGETDRRIRNTANGFVFTSQRVPPGDIVQQAIRAVGALGLDFGAVDIIWNERRQKAYVLEVNTAPGIEGITVEKYATKLKEYLRNERIQFTRQENFRRIR